MTIHVSVKARASRAEYQFRWYDPATGRGGECNSGVPKSAGLTAAGAAIPAFIACLEAKRPVGAEWDAFCQRLEEHAYPEWRPSTVKQWVKVRRLLERDVRPTSLDSMDIDAIRRFKAACRERNVEESTIDSYLRTIRSVLNKAVELVPGYRPPRIKTGSADPGGRPMTEKEVLTLLHQATGEERLALRLSSWTGLRLGQLCRLSWDATQPIRVEWIDSDCPMLVVSKQAHKGKRTERIPLLPPAVRILRSMPSRSGAVFSLEARSFGIRVSQMCRSAGIVTGTTKTRNGNVKPRYASIHDLKRTFIRRLLCLGFWPTEVARFAQHKRFDVTWEFYAPQASQLVDRVRTVYARRKTA